MDYYSLSDSALEEEIGDRIKSLRLRKNITQKDLSESTRLSINAIKSLEAGRSKISTLIVVLRELGALEQLDNFIPAVSISPLQLAKMQGKVRTRASGNRSKKPDNALSAKKDSEW